ncbi:hypothetical protein AB6D11_18765 [Vibrio splendidus]
MKKGILTKEGRKVNLERQAWLKLAFFDENETGDRRVVSLKEYLESNAEVKSQPHLTKELVRNWVRDLSLSMKDRIAFNQFCKADDRTLDEMLAFLSEHPGHKFPKKGIATHGRG